MPSPFTAIIIDDEPKAIELLKDCIIKSGKNIDIRLTCTSGETALKVLQQEKYDMVFLDIAMPGQNGFSVLAQLPEIASEVIFVTAHTEYALQAFRFSPTGYVLKPIDARELSNAVDKAIERILARRELVL